MDEQIKNILKNPA